MAGGYMLRMKQLPKPEYTLMKEMMVHYNLDTDPAELFLCLLRLAYEIHHSTHLHIDNGTDYITQIIATHRNNPTEIRHYTMP